MANSESRKEIGHESDRKRSKRRLPGRVKKMLRRYYLNLCLDKRDDFLWEIGTSHNYLQQIYCGHKTASENLARRIEAASAGIVLAHTLRPRTKLIKKKEENESSKFADCMIA